MLSKRDKIIILITIIVIISSLIFLLERKGIIISPFKQEKASIIKVGIILPFENSTLPQGGFLKKSAQLAIEQVNQNNKRKKLKMEAMWRDGGCNQNQAYVETENLLLKEGVIFFIGAFCKSELKGMTEAAVSDDSLILSLSSLGELNNDYIFSLSENKNLNPQKVANYILQNLNAKKAAVVMENRSFNNDELQIFEDFINEEGGQITGVERINPRDPQFEIIAQSLAEQQPEVVYLLIDTTVFASRLIDQLQNYEVDVPVITSKKILSDSSLADYPNLEKVLMLDTYFDSSSEEFNHFTKDYNEYYIEEPIYAREQATIFTAVKLLASALDREGADREKIKDYFDKLSGYSTPLGEISFNEDGSLSVDYIVKRVSGGKIITSQIDDRSR